MSCVKILEPSLADMLLPVIKDIFFCTYTIILPYVDKDGYTLLLYNIKR